MSSTNCCVTSTLDCSRDPETTEARPPSPVTHITVFEALLNVSATSLLFSANSVLALSERFNTEAESRHWFPFAACLDSSDRLSNHS